MLAASAASRWFRREHRSDVPAFAEQAQHIQLVVALGEIETAQRASLDPAMPQPGQTDALGNRRRAEASIR